MKPELKSRIEKALTKVVDQLIELKQIDGDAFQELSVEEQQKIGYFARDFGMGHWDWPQGVGIFGLSQFGEKYQEYIVDWGLTEIGKGLPLANINTICPLLTLMDHSEFETLSLKWADEVMTKFNRTKEQGLQHDTTGATKDMLTINEGHLWADTIFMTVLFLAKMGRRHNRPEWIQEAIYQVLLHVKVLLDKETKLFCHGWDDQQNDNLGSIYWCRGNSWLTMGIPLFLQYTEETLDSGTKRFLIGVYQNQVSALMALQDQETGLWHTLLEDSTSYIETSGSAGIVAGIYVGIEGGYLEADRYLKECSMAVAGLLSSIDEEGTVTRVSAGTAISREPENYKQIIRKPMAYGQALMIFALVSVLNTQEHRGWNQ